MSLNLPSMGVKRLRDRVGDADRLDAELSRLQDVSRFEGAQIQLGSGHLLFELVADERMGEFGCVERAIYERHQVRQSPDVILVSVGDENASQLVLVFDQIGEVGNDDVDTEHLLVRKA